MNQDQRELRQQLQQTRRTYLSFDSSEPGEGTKGGTERGEEVRDRDGSE
jgi:hypothetical protein